MNAIFHRHLSRAQSALNSALCYASYWHLPTWRLKFAAWVLQASEKERAA